MNPESLPARSAAQDLIAFIHALSPKALPATVIDHAKWCLLDSLGCALFGSRQPWAMIVAEEMLAEGSRGQSSIVGCKQTLPAPAAAFCNGTATHGFELDDLLDEAIVHPGAIIVPAALAAAECTGATGSRLLLGIIAGYEAMNRVGLALGLEPARRGYHKTAVVGPIGAAVAAGVVMNLNFAQLSAAVGLACSTASGTKSFAAGTGGGMMKRMHAGRAAEAGVRMAQLASRGFTAPPTALDGRFGLLEAFSGDTARPEQLAVELGQRWAVTQVFVKVYPVCSWIQATVQQLVALRGPEPFEASQVRSVKIGVNAYAIRSNGEPTPPDTMGAQYSIPYCAALALTANPSDPLMYAPEAIADVPRRDLAKRVELVVDPQMEAAYPKHYGARVEINLANGESRASMVMDPHGMPGDPCTDAERVEKFSRLASRVKSPEAVAGILRKVKSAESLSSVHELAARLRD